jgi:ubiquinone/menaquinone biosynthesis C-methylase UbiE
MIVLRILLWIVIGVLVFLFFWLVIVRHIFKFPIPEFMTELIDNPLRHRLQPPDEAAARHKLEPGMTVLEVGPGKGTYTLAAAKRIGEGGKLIAIDIEPKIIARLQARLEEEGISNIEARVADVFDLPFEDGTFDAIWMIGVIGEIPTPERAFAEFYRVLKAGGTLAFSELLPDPDYPSPRRLKRLGEAAGFRFVEKTANVYWYTVIFEKGE